MNNTTQQLEAIQRMMVPDFAALQDNVRGFWDTQDKVLDAMENLANSWFERRHVGTHASAGSRATHVQGTNPGRSGS